MLRRRRPGMMMERSESARARLRVAVGWRARRWLRVRPRGIRHRADDAGDLALSDAAFAGGPAGADLFGRRPEFDAAVNVAQLRPDADLAVPDRRPRRRARGNEAGRASRPANFPIAS